MFRRSLALLVLFPFALGQQCITSTGTLPSTESPRVTLATNKGNIVIELFTQQTTAATNFKTYFEAGYYDTAVFNEVRSGKWLIGGGYTHLLAAQSSKDLGQRFRQRADELPGTRSAVRPERHFLRHSPVAHQSGHQQQPELLDHARGLHRHRPRGRRDGHRRHHRRHVHYHQDRRQ